MNPSAFRLPTSAFTQGELPLAGATEDALRAAFEGSGLRARGYTYEAAMRIPHFKRCLENDARARLRRQSGIVNRESRP